ncbi:MAG: hypothetical protein NZZ41_06020 [Candidatus Dojkabacteria bacterium]|nr:hypothetical protein [Candidatus Dojkabacteria bacterium]
MNDEYLIKKYRKSLKEKLFESDSLGIGRLSIKKEDNKKYKTEILNKIKEKLLNNNKNEDIIERTVEIDEINEKNDNKDDDKDLLLGKKEEEENLLQQDDNDYNQKEESFQDEEEIQDIVNDTLLEVLQNIKDLREKIKQDDLQKAKIVRKIYDYILKGKDKIILDISKSLEKNDESDEIN